ncbi:autotransporter beta-domain protein [Chlamydia psittaci 08DC60]|nr:autotransporter beta-domain protein [Chlamydia psittaci 08DC60]
MSLFLFYSGNRKYEQNFTRRGTSRRNSKIKQWRHPRSFKLYPTS